MPWYLQILLCIIWAIVGIILTAPYSYLAGSGWFGAEPVGIVLAPVAAVVLYVVWHFRGSHWGGWTFWILATYCCFPILLNGVSAVLKMFQWYEPADFIFNWRYNTLVVIPALFVVVNFVGAVIFGIANKLLRRKSVQKHKLTERGIV